MDPGRPRNPALEKHGILPDPVIEAYKRDVDRTLLRENLKLTPEERLKNLIAMARFVETVRRENPRQSS